MSTQVFQNGGTVRVVVTPTRVTNAALDTSSHLILTYDDGYVQDYGPFGGGPTPTPGYLMDFRKAANAKYLGAML